MKGTLSLSDRKIALGQRLFAMGDAAFLEQLEELMDFIGMRSTIPTHLAAVFAIPMGQQRLDRDPSFGTSVLQQVDDVSSSLSPAHS